MNFKTTLITLTAVFSTSMTFAADLIYAGKTAEVKTSNQVVSKEAHAILNSEQISYILGMEARVNTVGEALELKTRGLEYVENIYDFEYLTSCPFASPSDQYKTSVGDFIAKYTANYVYSVYDIQTLNILEARVPTVGQAMAVKAAGLVTNLEIQDFVRLVAPVVGNPSDAYKTAISTFTAKNIIYAVNRRSDIYYILEAEKFTLTVGDAMAVKNAGLQAVRTQRDLFLLATFSVGNPSEAYKQAVNNFLRDNLSRFPRF